MKTVCRRDRQIVRVLWLLKVLSQGRQVSIPELAKQFGTRRETIYRDLRTLEDIGYPIQGDENGRLSRPRLLDARHISTPSLQLTPEERSALIGLIKHSGATIPFPGLARAENKLKAMQADSALSPADYDRTFGVSRTTVKQTANEQIIADLVHAILMKHRCRITYRSPKSKSEKSYDYDPYRLRWVAGGLYCVGQIPAVGGLTTLAAERILSLELTSQVFDIESDLDLRRREQDAFGVTLDDPMTVIIHVRADQAPYVCEREWHPTQQVRQLPDDGIELTFRAGGTFEIERWILGWGDAVEVIAPESLRKSIKAKSNAMYRLYKRSRRIPRDHPDPKLPTHR